MAGWYFGAETYVHTNRSARIDRTLRIDVRRLCPYQIYNDRGALCWIANRGSLYHQLRSLFKRLTMRVCRSCSPPGALHLLRNIALFGSLLSGSAAQSDSTKLRECLSSSSILASLTSRCHRPSHQGRDRCCIGMRCRCWCQGLPSERRTLLWSIRSWWR